MELIRIVFILSTLLCSLVAGFVLLFAIVVMPGIKRLNAHDFLQAFKVMDLVIQNNQPVFLLIWVGSILMIVISALSGIFQLDGVNRLLILIASTMFLLGVQFPTITINIPLNNQVQQLELDSMTETELSAARTQFEHRWIKWNSIRTVFAVITSLILMILIYRL